MSLKKIAIGVGAWYVLNRWVVPKVVVAVVPADNATAQKFAGYAEVGLPIVGGYLAYRHTS